MGKIIASYGLAALTQQKRKKKWKLPEKRENCWRTELEGSRGVQDGPSLAAGRKAA